jgi:predicted TIM-barrel fold metal-dependent hydrolase
MEEGGIDVVCVNNVALTADGARAMNDYNAEIVAENSGRMVGFAAVPTAEGQNGAAELRYAITQLGFRGAKIYPWIQGVALDAPSMRPIYDTAAELGVPILTHTQSFPTSFSGFRGLTWADLTLDNPARLFTSGILRELPRLKVIFAHNAGGFLWYYRALLRRNPDWEPMFGGMYVDISPATRFDREEIMSAVKALGEEKVLFGIDYPWIPIDEVTQCVGHVRSLSLGEELEQKVLGSNAVSLLDLAK